MMLRLVLLAFALLLGKGEGNPILAGYFANWAQYHTSPYTYLPSKLAPIAGTLDQLMYAFAYIDPNSFQVVTVEPKDPEFYAQVRVNYMCMHSKLLHYSCSLTDTDYRISVRQLITKFISYIDQPSALACTATMHMQYQVPFMNLTRQKSDNLFLELLRTITQPESLPGKNFEHKSSSLCRKHPIRSLQ